MAFTKKPKQLTPVEMIQELASGLKKQAVQPNLHGYQPHRKQNIFHKSPKKIRLYIGGNRSGKTVGGVVEDLWWATGRHPYLKVPTPCAGRVISVDFVNGIEKIIFPIFKRWVIPTDLRGGTWEAAYDKQERVLHFANGSFIEFMSYDQDLDKFAGTSRNFIHFDEEPPKHIYTENLLRTTDVSGRIWLTMTPLDGMTWVYEELYEVAKDHDSDIIEVVEVSIHENPHLPKEEVAIVISLLDPDEAAAREHGHFVQLGGLIYKNFVDDPDQQHSNVFRSDPAEPWIPRKEDNWLIVCSLDHGFNNPTAWLWHAVNEEGDCITFWEHYQSGLTVDQHAAKVHEVNKRFNIVPDIYIGDPSIRNRDPLTGTSVHEEYIKLGIPIVLGNNDVNAGIIRVAKYIRTKASNGTAKWKVGSCCLNLIKEMKRYRWATYSNKTLQYQNNPQEKPHKKDDHACDSLRYFIMSRPDLAAEALTTPGPINDPGIIDAARNLPMNSEGDVIVQTLPKGNWTYDEMGSDW